MHISCNTGTGYFMISFTNIPAFQHQINQQILVIYKNQDLYSEPDKNLLNPQHCRQEKIQMRTLLT
jgi:hypothetical protein